MNDSKEQNNLKNLVGKIVYRTSTEKSTEFIGYGSQLFTMNSHATASLFASINLFDTLEILSYENEIVICKRTYSPNRIEKKLRADIIHLSPALYDNYWGDGTDIIFRIVAELKKYNPEAFIPEHIINYLNRQTLPVNS